jgi:surfeit locus 1 family protein
MRRLPLLSTLIVALAAAAMVWLGLWQLGRRAEKEALIARYAANVRRPPLPVAALYPVSDADLYRRVSATCLEAVGWTAESGRDVRRASGWRHIARCRTGAEGPGILVDMGVSPTPDAPRWNGGAVAGRLTWASDRQPLIARWFGSRQARTPMIVTATAAPGLTPTATPGPADLPNNHLAYAVQWFIFAALAVSIYAILLWRRRHGVAREGQHR